MDSDKTTDDSVSIILPAKNEGEALRTVLPELRRHVPGAEIIVVNDGSTDETEAVCREFEEVRLVTHRYSLGNGAAIKSGARNARGEILVFMDADGQHPPELVPQLLAAMADGYDMVVGARRHTDQASISRWFGNQVFNRLASWMTGHRIDDLTSGFRAVRRRKFLRILYLLPNKFSYPTTSTMAFFRSGYTVGYEPVRVRARTGTSHLRIFRDGIRFVVIILKIGALFSPMRLFLPVSSALFMLGLCNYAYTYIVAQRFTNMSALLLIAAILTFLIGIVSEQISALHYKDTENMDREPDHELARSDGDQG